MTVGMRSIRRTLTRPNLIPKTKRNRVVLLRTRLKTLWRSEIHVNLKIDADVAFVPGVQHIISIKDSEGCILICAHVSTVDGVGGIKSKTKQSLPTVLLT
jgi:hypothetical protein